MFKRLFYISVVVTVVFLFSAVGSAFTIGKTLTEGIKAFHKFLPANTDYVAMVGQEKITVSEYKFYLTNIKFSIEQAVGIIPENEKSFWSGRLGNTSAEGYAKEQALTKAQEFKIQIIKAKESGLKLDANDNQAITTYINTIVSNYNGKTSAEKAIKSTYGISLDELKTIYGESRLIDKFVEYEKGKIKPEGSQLKDYYNANMEVPGKITTVCHIMISTKDETGNTLSEGEISQKEKLAEDILALVNSGTDFNSLVQKYSEDPGSKDTGGEYTFRKGEMVKEFEDWAFNAKPGDTGLIQSDYGFHIMKKPTFEEMQDVIKEKYLDQEYENMLNAWKSDKKYAVVKNNAVYTKITVFNVTTGAN